MKPKYDKETLNQLKDLSQDRKDVELEKALDDLRVLMLDFEERIKILEDARTRQQGLNANYSQALQPPLSQPKPSFFKRFFK